MDPDFFSEEVFLHCLSFLYTGKVDISNQKEKIEETITAAHFLNLPELVSVIENAKKEKVMPSVFTIIEWNIDVTRKLFFNKVKMVEGRVY